MKTKTAWIISGSLVAVFGIAIYLYRRKKNVDNLQKQIAQNTGSLPDNKPAAKQASPVAKMATLDWLVGGD